GNTKEVSRPRGLLVFALSQARHRTPARAANAFRLSPAPCAPRACVDIDGFEASPATIRAATAVSRAGAKGAVRAGNASRLEVQGLVSTISLLASPTPWALT